MLPVRIKWSEARSLMHLFTDVTALLGTYTHPRLLLSPCNCEGSTIHSQGFTKLFASVNRYSTTSVLVFISLFAKRPKV